VVTNSSPLLLLALLLALANGMACHRANPMPSERSTSSASDNPVVSVVHALGRIEPESRIVEVGAPLGSIVSKIAVAEGDAAAEGDVLAILDSHDEMLAAKELATVQLRDAQERQRVEAEISQAAIEIAELEQQHAQEVLPRKIQAQESQVRRHEAGYEETQRDLERAELLRAGDVISNSELDNLKLALRTANEAVQESREVLAQLRRDREIKLAMARVGLQQATAQKERQRIVAEVDALARAAAVAAARYERTIVRAPLAGRVIKIYTRPGERIANEPVLKMGNTDSMLVVAEVYESDVTRVQIGQRVTIRSRAFPEELTGHVLRIGTLVERSDVLSIDPAADVDARIVEVGVKLDDSRVAANYNQHQVDVIIHLDERDGNIEQSREQGSQP